MAIYNPITREELVCSAHACNSVDLVTASLGI
jgi:hypothetical protein